jgi:GntP family gluconate:H+ symporter/Gnt-I system low-affinity gluconate transporter
MEGFIASPQRLILAAVLGMALLLFLIIRGKLQPIIAIVVSAITIGVLAGMPLPMIVSTIEKGVGSTLSGIALLIGLGSMFGAILECSGGAEQIAATLVGKFGDNKAAWALGLTGLIIGMPVFFDAGLIILIPLAFGLARKAQKSTLTYAIPLLAGLAVGHAFIPPTPGPVLVASMLGVELGYVIGVGIVVGLVAMIVAGPVFGKYIGDKIYIPVPKNFQDMAAQAEGENKKLPSFGTVAAIILVPLVLILLNTLSKVIPALAPMQGVFSFLGTPFVALTISTLLAMFLLGTKNGFTKEELEKVMTKSLEPTGLVLLVTAGGGILRFMLQDSGLGDIIGNAVAGSSLPLVIVAFIIAGAVRISIGSATVSMTMAAGIMAAMPEISGLPQMHLAAIVMAIAGGATIMSHVNDSGFWLVKSLFQIDEKTTFKTWTVMETIIGVVGVTGGLIVSILF